MNVLRSIPWWAWLLLALAVVGYVGWSIKRHRQAHSAGGADKNMDSRNRPR